MDLYASRRAQLMLIAGESEPFDSEDYSFELKMDGERCLAYLGPDGVFLASRRGRPFLPQFPELAALHRQVEGRCIVDGELIVGEGRKEDFERIKQRSQARRPAAIQRLAAENPTMFVALDLLYHDGRDLTEEPLVARQAQLRRVVHENERLNVVRTIDGKGVAFYDLVRKEGLEGVIAKRKDSPYRMGKRTRDWTKIKNWLEADFVICGYMPTRAAVVSILLGQYRRDGEFVFKGRTTLGLRRDGYAQLDGIPRTALPFDDTPEGTEGAVWIEPRLVCTVGFLCWTAGGRLRQPFFKAMRPDLEPRQAVEPDNVTLC